MDNRLATLTVALIVLLSPLTAHALTAQIEGRVVANHNFEPPSGPIISDRGELEFNEAMSLNALSSFAIATQTSDHVLASTGGRVGNGWMQFQSTASTALFAAPLGSETSGGASFRVFITVVDTITIDAPGMTGTPGSANLGYWIDGVLSSALDGALFPRSSGEIDGSVYIKADFIANSTTTTEFLYGVVGSPDWKGLPAALGFSNHPLGGLVNFTYGTPIDLLLTFDSEGGARAESDGDDDVTGLPVASTIVSDFGHTIGWAGVQGLRDANGNAVTDFTAVSSTGTDFRLRIAPDDALIVPEPSTMLLLLLAAGPALLGARRVRQFGHSGTAVG